MLGAMTTLDVLMSFVSHFRFIYLRKGRAGVSEIKEWPGPQAVLARCTICHGHEGSHHSDHNMGCSIKRVGGTDSPGSKGFTDDTCIE